MFYLEDVIIMQWILKLGGGSVEGGAPLLKDPGNHVHPPQSCHNYHPNNKDIDC